MLAGKGFKEVYNLSGGIKAWNSGKAVGSEDLGLDIFSGKETPEETLIVAYSLEEGLREFYLSMVDSVNNEKTSQLFQMLSTIEIKHQDRIFDEYIKVSGASVSRDEFAKTIVAPAMEGGLTTEEYLDRYELDLDVPEEVISLAMAIESQALDLYQRAADRSESGGKKSVLARIADEERVHLQQLGQLFENL